jgi:gliding motility-associated-like protein
MKQLKTYLSTLIAIVAICMASTEVVIASCATVNTSFTTSQVDICGQGPTTINFTNTSTGPNAGNATTGYTWYLNGAPFDNTGALAAPIGSNIGAAGTYTYMMVAYDSLIPCRDTAYVIVNIYLVPNADYTFTPNNACGNVPINFTSTSTGTMAGTTYFWDFGDGNNSNQQNPTHNYNAGGTYNVTLTVTNGPGCTSNITNTVTLLPIPVVNISGDDGDGDLINCLLPADPTVQETVVFTNTTTGAVSYAWDFGDGSPIDNSQNPSHLYTSYGTFTVTMTATHANGCTAVGTLTVVFEKYVSSSLTLDITEYSGCAPHTLTTLANLSVNANTYVWDFGDGSPPVTTTSPIPPNHEYTTGGTYTITLTASNSCNTATATISPIIIVDGPTANFTATPNPGCAPQVVNFNNLSTDVSPNNNYYWDMGNGNTYTNTVTPPAQTYPNVGNYTVMLVAGSACGFDTVYQVIVIDTIPVVDLTVIPDTGCSPLTVTSINLSTGQNLTYAWYIDGIYTYNTQQIPDQTFTAPAGNASVTHTIRLVVSNHCGTDDTTVTIVVHPPVQAIFSLSTDTVCEGGSITFTDGSLGSNLSWEWDFGEGTLDNTQGPHTITYNTAGTYMVELIVNGFCGPDTLQIPVVALPIPVADIVPDITSGCEPLTANFTNNSTPGGTYNWNFGPNGTPLTSNAFTPPPVTFTGTGIQMITLDVDVLGCTDSDTVYIDIFPLPVPTFTATPNDGCTPLDVTFNNTSAVSAGDTYFWDFGNGNTSNAQNPGNETFIALANDSTYTVWLTIQTTDGCIDSISAPITVHPLPVANFTALPDTVCIGTPVAFLNNSTGATSYAWDFGDGNTSTLNSPSNTYANQGNYTVELIAYTAFNCTDTVTALVVVDSIPGADFTFSIECLGDSTSFTDISTGGITNWAWDFGDGSPIDNTQNPTHLYAASGSYNVVLTVTNPAGCTHFITQLVTVNDVPVAAFTTNPTCLGSPSTFTDNTTGVPIGWQWDFGDGSPIDNNQNPTHIYAATGTYTVELIVSAGSGCSDTITGTITINPVPTADFNFTAVCTNDTTFFTDASGGAPDIWEWDFGDGSPVDNNQNPDHVYTTAGTYNVMLVAGYAATGCTDTIYYTVDAHPRTVPGFTNNTPCLGAATSFTDGTTGTPTQWEWDFGDGSPLDNTQNPTHIYAAPGLYTVTLVTENVFTCSDTVTAVVEVYPLPTADFTFDTICDGFNTTFTDQSTSAVQWEWDFGDGSPFDLNASPTHLYAASGQYNVQLVVTNVEGCTDTIVYLVDVNPNPISSFAASVACHTYPTIFTDQSTAAIQWQWDFGDGSPLDNTQNPSHTYALDGTYNVTLVVTNVFGCTDVLTQAVTVLPQPQAAFTTNPTCLGSISQFTDASTGLPTGWEWDFGDGSPIDNNQNPTHTYPATGTYTVELVITGGGCSDTITSTITVTPVPTADFNFTAVCTNDTTFFTDISGGTPDTWEWDFGDGSPVDNSQHPNHVYTLTGTYNVMLVAGYAASGCTDTIYYTVDAHPRTIPGFTSNIPCLNAPSVFTDTTLGTPTQWEWDFGDGSPLDNTQNPIHIYAAPGLYTVTLVTENVFTCSDTATAIVEVYPLPTADFTFDTICDGFTTTFTDLSTSAVQWEWDFGDGSPFDLNASPTHLYAASGQYNVQLVVTNVEGCTDTVVYIVDVNPNPVSNFTATTACHTYPTQFTDQSTAAVQWEWNFGDGSPFDNTQNPSYVYAIDGSYNVTLVVTNVFGCTDTLTQVVIVLPQPQAGFMNTTVCAGHTVTFTDTTTGAPTIWDWDFGDGSPINNNQNPVHIYTAGGQYTTTLIVNNPSGCTDTITGIIDVHTVPIPDFIADTACLFNVTTFTDLSTDVVAITGWYWDFGDGNNSFAQHPTYIYQASGIYTVSLTVTNINGCDSTFTQQVLVTDVPVAAFTSDTVCVGAATTFTDISTGLPTTWLWDFGDGSPLDNTGPITSHTYAAPGSYLVSMIVSGGTGCTDQAFGIVIVSNDAVAAIQAPDSACVDAVITILDVSTINSGTITNWDWDFGDGNTSTLPDNTYSYSTPGTYIITLTVTTDGGCASTTTHSITINPLPIADFVSTVPCENQPVDFTDLSQGNGGVIDTWAWDFGDGNNSSVQNPSHQYAASGQYNVELIVYTTSGCSDTASKPALVYPQPVAAFTNNTVCQGDTVNFVDQSTVGGGGNIISWDWDFGDGNTSNLQNPDHAYLTYSDSFYVSLIVETDFGCIDTVTQLVETLPIAYFDFTPDIVNGCQPLEVNFTDNSNVANGNVVGWVWDFGDGIFSFGQNPTHTYADSGSYFVNLTVTTSDGCVYTDTLNYPITVYPQPVAGFDVTPTVTSILAPDVEVTDASIGALFWEYEFGDLSYSNDQNPEHSYQNPGVYWITQIVTNGFGCQDTAQHFVNIYQEFSFYTPNAFTPDEDGINDIFYASGFGFEEFTMQIFDRWGLLLFETSSLSNGWDGFYKGVLSQQDVYVWQAKVKDINGDFHTFRGHVTLVR